MAATRPAKKKLPNPQLTERFVVGYQAQEGFVTNFLYGDSDNSWPPGKVLPAVMAAGWRINAVYPGPAVFLFQVGPMPRKRKTSGK